MAISKPLRFEVLRRDGHACRYCGAKASDGIKLVVDHVIPQALGGLTEPENLVAACQPCNSGKSSTMPDAALVADVRRDQAMWVSAIATAKRLIDSEQNAYTRMQQLFLDQWERWEYGPESARKKVPLDASWRNSITAFARSGLDEVDIVDAVQVAMKRDKVDIDSKFRYFAGICWKKIDEIQVLGEEIYRDRRAA